jgi:hypothetical protein
MFAFKKGAKKESEEADGPSFIQLDVVAKLVVNKAEDLLGGAPKEHSAHNAHDFFRVDLFEVMEEILAQRAKEGEVAYISAIELQADLVQGTTLHSEYIVIANPAMKATQSNALFGEVPELRGLNLGVEQCFAFVACPDIDTGLQTGTTRSCTRLELAPPSPAELDTMRTTAKYHRSNPSDWFDGAELPGRSQPMRRVPKYIKKDGKPNPLYVFFEKNALTMLHPAPLQTDEHTVPRAVASELMLGTGENPHVVSKRLLDSCITFVKRTRDAAFHTRPFLKIIPLSPFKKFTAREETITLPFKFEYVIA